MAFRSINADEVDAKSPIDDYLMDTVKQNDDDLNARLVTSGNSPFVWEINGPMRVLRNFKRSVGMTLINKEYTPIICRFALKKSGTSGNIAFDIRKHAALNLAIQGISHQFSGSTNSVARVAGASTQSIARATAQVSTQSISYAKTSLNVQSIVQVPGTNLWRYNFSTTPDSDYSIGDTILFASCTSGGNNGAFAIKEINQSNGFNVVVNNASGVEQAGAAGTGQLLLFSYNFVNPVSSQFVAGESALFASHSTGGNNGTLPIYAVNSGGNNVWVKNASGAVQAGVAGTMDNLRWVYTYSVAVSTTFFVVGQLAHFESHSSGGNNGDFPITAVNSGGNNIVVYNTGGATQGGAAGSGTPNHWTYFLASDPSAQVAVADTILGAGHSTPFANGVYPVSAVDSSSVTVYNANGAAQGSAAGTVSTTRKLVKFSSDQSASFTLLSYIEMIGCPSSYYNVLNNKAPFRVLQINRGGGANYNVVIDVPYGPEQAGAAGMVAAEMKSIFSSSPSLAFSKAGLTGNENIVGVSSAIIAEAIPAQTPLKLYFTEIMGGQPRDFTVSLS